MQNSMATMTMSDEARIAFGRGMAETLPEKDTIGGPSQLSPWKFGAQVHGRKRLRPRQSDEQASINEFRFLDDLNGV